MKVTMKQEKFLIDIQNDSEIVFIGPYFQDKAIPKNTSRIYIDAGATLRESSDFTGHSLSLGDGDSYAGILDVTLNQEKDYSDLSYAFSILPPKISTVILIGFLGGRRDHEYINLGAANSFIQAPNKNVFFDNGLSAHSMGTRKLDIQGTFSIFCFEDSEIKISGKAKYQCLEWDNISLLSSKYLSNIGDGEVQIELKTAFFIDINQG